MTVQIRTAVPDDWPRLWPLLQGMGTRSDATSARVRFERLASDPSWCIVVAADDGELVGYGAVQDHGEPLRAGREGRVARLHDLFVAPPRRGTGIGRALMDAVVAWAGERVAYLQWQAHETTAAPFYERLGYRGDPCPQPDYPEFEVVFPARRR